MAINEMRARIALKYEGKTFIEEEDGILLIIWAVHRILKFLRMI